MAPHESLWPFSAATLRKMFGMLLSAVGLPTEKPGGVRPFSLDHFVQGVLPGYSMSVKIQSWRGEGAGGFQHV